MHLLTTYKTSNPCTHACQCQHVICIKEANAIEEEDQVSGFLQRLIIFYNTNTRMAAVAWTLIAKDITHLLLVRDQVFRLLTLCAVFTHKST